MLDWTTCSAVERHPQKVSGAWVFRGTRVPVSALFTNIEGGATVYERGWAVLTNGDLLAAAELAGFDIMITTDQGIRHQQNLAGRKLSLLVIDTNDWTRIRRSKALIVAEVS